MNEVNKSGRLKPNAVTLLASVVGVLALVRLPLFAPGWLLFKANRLVAGDPHLALELSLSWTLTLVAVWLLTLVLSLLELPKRVWLTGASATLALVLAALFVGREASGLMEGAGTGARVSLLGGVWLTVLAYYMAMFGAWQESRASTWVKLLLPSVGVLGIVLLIFLGTFGDLGMARELANQRGTFSAELFRHLALSGTSVFLATVIGVPAAIWAAREARVAALVLPTASFLQTLPSLALFGIMLAPLARLGQQMTVGQAALYIALGLGALLLLGTVRAVLKARLATRLRAGLVALMLIVAALPLALFTVIVAVLLSDVVVALLRFDLSLLPANITWATPLSRLGVRGIGSAPALIALTLYSFLPIVRNCYTGIKEVPRAATEAGRGMGMSRGQILRRVELPLALPLIVEGIRASAVLTIGITTVAFLIGAGGLGTFIQRGIDQVVPDLILIGAVPVILLALVADGVQIGRAHV